MCGHVPQSGAGGEARGPRAPSRSPGGEPGAAFPERLHMQTGVCVEGHSLTVGILNLLTYDGLKSNLK